MTPNELCACLVAQSYPTLCNPMDCSLPDSSVHGIFQARKLKWVATSSSWPRDWTCLCSCIRRQILYHCTTWEAPMSCAILQFLPHEFGQDLWLSFWVCFAFPPVTCFIQQSKANVDMSFLWLCYNGLSPRKIEQKKSLLLALKKQTAMLWHLMKKACVKERRELWAASSRKLVRSWELTKPQRNESANLSELSLEQIFPKLNLQMRMQTPTL